MTLSLRTLLFGAVALLLGACGGGGGSPPAPGTTDFVPFFASVYQQPAQPNAPVALSNLSFVGQFPDDETTFDFLLD